MGTCCQVYSMEVDSEKLKLSVSEFGKKVEIWAQLDNHYDEIIKNHSKEELDQLRDYNKFPFLTYILCYARQEYKENYVKCLLAKGCNPEVLDRYSETPLQTLSKSLVYKSIPYNKSKIELDFSCLSEKIAQHMPIIEMLLKRGANPNDSPNSACSALYPWWQSSPFNTVILAGSPQVIWKFLCFGADVWQKDKYGFTPLHIVAFTKRYDLMPLLLVAAYKKDQNIDNLIDKLKKEGAVNSNFSPLKIAQIHNSPLFIKLFSNKECIAEIIDEYKSIEYKFPENESIQSKLEILDIQFKRLQSLWGKNDSSDTETEDEVTTEEDTSEDEMEIE